MNVYQALLRDGAAKRSLWKCEKCGAHAQDVTELVEALQWLKDAMTEGDQSDVNHAIAKCFEALSKYKGAKG